MANTFSQIYLQCVFAVKGRQSLIEKKNKEELHKYITALAQNRKAKLLAINCMPDHTHLFVGFKPTIHISDFIKEPKSKAMNLSITKNGSTENLAGRKGMAYSRIHILTLMR